MLLKGHESGRYTQGRVYYVGPRATPGVSSILLDLSSSEVVARPPTSRPIAHAYPDQLPAPGVVQCYCAQEVFAEKIRALGERVRPRDLYDVVNLYRRQDFPVEPGDVYSALVEKCRTKGMQIPTAVSVLEGPRRAELESEWGNMLAHQLPALPTIEDFLAEVPRLFAWLTEAENRPTLPPVPALGTPENPAWRAPAAISTWHAGVPLESIRFAAVGHLCVELGYESTRRVIEPYALRETRDGDLLLHAIRVDDREHRSYRVDRIESVKITDRSFVPQYAIEFGHDRAASGPL